MTGDVPERLSFRPRRSPATGGGATGEYRLPSVDGASPAAVYVPPGATGPLRLVVVLHGAGGVARSALRLLRGRADDGRLLLLAPGSTGRTWDVIRGGYGPDVRMIDRLLDEVASAYPLSGVTLAGFSDGGTYALSLGLANGDVFDSVIAFSPGYRAKGTTLGTPRVFVSHGTGDDVLPIDRCSRRLVPRLRRTGYEVTYHEFDGGHTVPSQVVRRAATWLQRGH